MKWERLRCKELMTFPFLRLAVAGMVRMARMREGGPR